MPIESTHMSRTCTHTQNRGCHFAAKKLASSEDADKTDSLNASYGAYPELSPTSPAQNNAIIPRTPLEVVLQAFSVSTLGRREAMACIRRLSAALVVIDSDDVIHVVDKGECAVGGCGKSVPLHEALTIDHATLCQCVPLSALLAILGRVFKWTGSESHHACCEVCDALVAQGCGGPRCHEHALDASRPQHSDSVTGRRRALGLMGSRDAQFTCRVCHAVFRHDEERNGTAPALVAQLLTHACTVRGKQVAKLLSALPISIPQLVQRQIADAIDQMEPCHELTWPAFCSVVHAVSPPCAVPRPESLPPQPPSLQMVQHESHLDCAHWQFGADSAKAQVENFTHVFWDFDSVLPRRMGSTCSRVFEALSERFRFVRGRIGSAQTYLKQETDYGSDVDRLQDLGFAVRYAGSKRSDGSVDRLMVHDLLALMLNTPAEAAPRTHVVIISGDRDFNKQRLLMKERGFQMHTVHSAIQGSEHEHMLRPSSTSLTHISELLSLVSMATACAEVPVTAASKRRTPPPEVGRPLSKSAMTPSQDVPTTVLVDGHRVRTSDLVPNGAVKYLAKNATASGRWCTLASHHSEEACSFVHIHGHVSHVEVDGVIEDKLKLVRDYTLRTKIIPDGMRRGEAFGPSVCVTVGGARVPVDQLQFSAGIELLLQRTGGTGGQYCTRADAHDVYNCQHIHRKLMTKVPPPSLSPPVVIPLNSR